MIIYKSFILRFLFACNTIQLHQKPLIVCSFLSIGINIDLLMNQWAIERHNSDLMILFNRRNRELKRKRF